MSSLRRLGSRGWSLWRTASACTASPSALPVRACPGHWPGHAPDTHASSEWRELVPSLSAAGHGIFSRGLSQGAERPSSQDQEQQPAAARKDEGGSASGEETGKAGHRGSPQGEGSQRSAEGPRQQQEVASEDRQNQTSDAEQQGGEEAQPYVHTHLTQHERMRKMQPIIEEMEVQKADAAMSRTPLSGSFSSWSLLYDGPLRRLLGGLLVPVRLAASRTLLQGLLGRLEGTAETIIRAEVETDFDAEDFLEGVREAAACFYDAVVAGDDATLARMASSRVRQVVAQDMKMLAAVHGIQVTDVQTHVHRAHLAGVNVWGPLSIAMYDKSWLEDVTPSTTKSWLVVSVTLDVTLDVTYKLADPLKGGASEGGKDGDGGRDKDGDGDKEVATVSAKVYRVGSWLMARGPLPPGQVRSLNCGWKLLAWW